MAGFLMFGLAAAGVCDEAAAPAGLSRAFEMKSGVYNPWTRRCSDAAAPVRRKMYLRQPAEPGKYPVFLFLIGTLRKHDTAAARNIVDRAAARGFVAAAVDYDTIAGVFRPKGVCDSVEAKARCSLAVGDTGAPESALGLICGNTRIDGQSAGLYADCDQGILLAGFSQGASLAMLGRNVEERVRAVWGMGFHDQAFPDKKPLGCLHAGTRALPPDRLRLIVGENDRVLRKPHQQHLQAVTGRICEPGARSCLAEDGSGWAIVPNEECGRKCQHEYLDTRQFLQPSTWWGVDQNLDWLERFVRGAQVQRKLVDHDR